MQNGQWVSLLFDLIGGGAVVSAMVAALAFGLVFRQLLREMKLLISASLSLLRLLSPVNRRKLLATAH